MRLTVKGAAAQQGPRGYDQAQMAKLPPGEQPGQGGQHRPVDQDSLGAFN
jgi:hypothetical protein